ncbi:MAG: hypothetical protein Q9219_007657 [cf. Caloplaca sp. 3 TL-2023]
MAILSTIRGWLKAVANLFKASEPPLRPGYRRIRWICPCCCEELWEDWKEVDPERLDALQAWLWHASKPYDPHNRSTFSVQMQNLSDADPPPNPLRSVTHSKNSTTGSSIYQSASSFRSQGSRSGKERTGIDDQKFRVFAMFVGLGWNDTLVVDHSLPRTTTDLELFQIYRKDYESFYSGYFRRFGRFCGWRSITKISVRRFRETPQGRSVFAPDWPTGNDCPPWTFHLSGGKDGIMKTTLFMRYWQDCSPKKWWKPKSLSNGCYRSIPETGEIVRDPRVETASYSSFVFERLPKLVGSQPFVEGGYAWGLLFEERSMFPTFLNCVCYFYLVFALVYGLKWYMAVDSIGQISGANAFIGVMYCLNWLGLFFSTFKKVDDDEGGLLATL